MLEAPVQGSAICLRSRVDGRKGSGYLRSLLPIVVSSGQAQMKIEVGEVGVGNGSGLCGDDAEMNDGGTGSDLERGSLGEETHEESHDLGDDGGAVMLSLVQGGGGHKRSLTMTTLSLSGIDDGTGNQDSKDTEAPRSGEGSEEGPESEKKRPRLYTVDSTSAAAVAADEGGGGGESSPGCDSVGGPPPPSGRFGGDGEAAVQGHAFNGRAPGRLDVREKGKEGFRTGPDLATAARWAERPVVGAGGVGWEKEKQVYSRGEPAEDLPVAGGKKPPALGPGLGELVQQGTPEGMGGVGLAAVDMEMEGGEGKKTNPPPPTDKAWAEDGCSVGVV
ncbi:unnamed protein product, partial [Discosporangium mesarthrocarpum]